MTVKEYLEQARKLNVRIDYLMNDLQRMKQLSQSYSSPSFDSDRVMTSQSSDASFVRCIARINEMEQEISKEVDLLFALKEQIRSLVATLNDPVSEVILLYHYLDGLGWSAIGRLVYLYRTTVADYHDRALSRLVLPDDAIQI